MSHATKLVLHIIINIVTGITLHEMAPQQYGFMPDKGTINAIFVLRRFVESSVEKQNDVYNCFIDYSKAFDTLTHESLVELWLSLNVDEADNRLLTSLYWNLPSAVQCDTELSDWSCIKQGVRQTRICGLCSPICLVHKDANESNRRIRRF